MEHHFDIEVAKEYGIVEAVLINLFQFWITKNKANNIHSHDGRFWTYCSQRALLEIFPYLSRQNLRTIIKHLVKKGVIIIGNYNTAPYDKTNWYAFVDEKRWIYNNQPTDGLKLTNGCVETNQPIPDINVQSKDCTTLFDNKPNIIKEENISPIPPIIPHEEKRKGANLDTSFVEDEYKDAYMQWLEYKRAIKKPYKTQQSLELNYRQAKSLAGNDPQTFRLIIEQSIGNGWTGLFELKTNYHESTTVNSPSNGLNEPERRKRNYDFAF